MKIGYAESNGHHGRLQSGTLENISKKVKK